MSEPEVSQKKPRKRGRLLAFATLAVLALCCIPFGWRYYRAAAVQNALVRDWEISFEPQRQLSGGQDWVYDKLGRLMTGREELFGRENPEEIYPERVRVAFLGDITEIGIYYPEGFRGDLGAALLRFRELKKFTVYENEPYAPTESDYKLLCQRLRELPALEEIELGGAQISSDALKPLAGHSMIRKLNLSYSTRLTTDVLHTLKSLPALQTLEIRSIFGPDEEKWKSPSLHLQFREALPGVTLELPQP
jgi:hypothetical protein